MNRVSPAKQATALQWANKRRRWSNRIAGVARFAGLGRSWMRAPSWPSDSGEEIGVIYAPFAAVAQFIKKKQVAGRMSFAARHAVEKDVEALWVTIPALGTPVSLCSETKLHPDRTAILADSEASFPDVAEQIKLLLKGFDPKVEFYQDG